ncbi:MAG: hypothetical protein IPM98_01200 [Lewinellaceae bacterium]|nr:hypothetical protein [Lewinellaceae bacterium]
MYYPAVLSNLTKTYSGNTYKYTTLLRHKGTLIAFTMDNRRRIHYAVLDQNPAAAQSPLDVTYWPGGPTELLFPNEIAETGFGIADQTLLPTYQNGSPTPAKPGARLAPRDIDFFRSTTARLSADAPFQVLSDGQSVYLFRQAIDANHPDQIFKQDKTGKPVLDSAGKPVPLVDATLLVDRFVLVGAILEPRLEIRFQRSRSKTRPASRKDNLGAKDLDGNDFYEPTQELKFVGNLEAGRFAVLLLPTSVAEVERWQIFAQNRHTGRMDAFSIERSPEGLFNTRGSQVFAPELAGHAEAALQLTKPTDHIALAKGVTPGATFSFEGWIFPEQTQSTQPQVLIAGAKSGTDAGGLSLLVVAQTRLRVDFGSGQGDKFTSKSMLTPNTWNHIAVTFDGGAFRFYIGGNLRDKIDLPPGDEKPPAKPILFLGAAQNAFKGVLDEICLWNRPRSAREIQADLHQRLTGLEPGLAAYWRFDEAGGDTVFDQSNYGADGRLNGGAWITSDAPIGDNPGINRSSFLVAGRLPDGSLENRSIASGLSALLYFQQANVSSGYDGAQKPLKQSARVMLAFATKGASSGDKNYIASLDFAVSASGKIAAAPDRLPLELVHPDGAAQTSVNDQLDALKSAEEQVRVLAEAVAKAKKQEQKRDAEWLALKNEDAGAQVTAFAGADFTGAFRVFGKGDVRHADLFSSEASLNFNDKITALKIPAPLQVTVFEHDVDAAGQTKLFKEDTPDVGDFWRGKISGLRVAGSPDFATKIQKAEQRLLQARTERSAQETLLNNARTALAGQQSVLRSGASVTMPIVHLDAGGLLVSGGLLGFAWTNDAPLLFDSATGSLALYYRGADDQFFAAYYTTLTERAKYPLTNSTGKQTVICIARSTDLGMDKIALEVSDGPGADTCTVKIAGLELEEIWEKVPRNPERFARVLNGQAGHYHNNKLVGYRERIGAGTVVAENNGQLRLDIPGGTSRALEKNAALMLGSIRLTLKEPADADATSLPVGSESLVFPPEPQPLFYLEYDYAANARTTKVPGDLFGGSLLLRAVNLPGFQNLEGFVTNQRVTSGATLTSKWTAAAPGSTLLFNGTDTCAKLADTGKLNQLDPENDLTLEAWVRPLQVTEKARLIQHKSGAAEYALGLKQADLNSAFKLDGAADYVTIPKNPALNFAGSITIEAWIKPEATDGTRTIVAHGYPHRGTPELFLRIENGQYQTGIWRSGNNLAAMPIPEADKQGKDWIHLAGVYDAIARKWMLYRNGVLENSADSGVGAQVVEADWGIGANPDPGADVTDRRLWNGEIDDVRVWKRARTQAEILSDMNRRLAGNETDLAGYWHFQNGSARDYSRNANDGVLHGKPATSVSPLPAYTIFAGVNGKYVQGKNILPAGNWTHVTAVFLQNYGLKFSGNNAFLDCGKDETLNLNGDLTLEVFLKPEQFGRGAGILARDTGGSNKQQVPYSLAFDSSGRLVFLFEDRDGNVKIFKTSAKAQAGVSTRVAVTRQLKSQTYRLSDSETKTLNWYDIRLHLGAASESFIYAVDEITRLAVEELSKPSPAAIIIRAGKNAAPSIGRSNGNTYIGRHAAANVDSIEEIFRAIFTDPGLFEPRYFKGVISEVRIWSTARETAAVGGDIAGGENGLISWWRFEEREGVKTNDSNGQNHAALNGNIEWVKDDDPQRSGLTLLCNDQGALLTENLPGADFTPANNQFTLGALGTGAGLKELYCGELEEVRIWKTARTREQVEDNLFRRLNGEPDDLLAYYTFDAETQTKISDNGLRGNHLAPQGTAGFVLSTAPVGDDAPIVRSALAGIRTPFSGFIGSTPAVHEYGDMQTDSRGNTIGVFKRCYGFIHENALNLLTGYKVGDLAVEWIGQVQFAPQLIGFIEGAPPVPSENLTMPSVEMIGDLDDYNETSTVEFVRADETAYTYSASKEAGLGLEVEGALKFGFKSKTDAGVALAAASLSSIEESEILAGARVRFEAMFGWMDSASTGVSRETAKTTSLELRGRYTTPEENKNEPFGRRFVPDNLGLALVQSETADVFALRLKHNNALISFSLRPNPDIPKDWNIIHFPMNARYVKQGVLDGKIGPVTDVDYPNAFEYSNDVSYFKPVEAYALKNRIQKEEKALETYYNQFAAKLKGNIPFFSFESALEMADHSDLRARTRRNLVNTYVWTADGGLFAETQQMMQVHSETSGGSYEFSGGIGLDLKIGFAIFKVAAQFELNAMFVGQHRQEVSKTKESKTAFQLNVSVEKVERDIYLRQPDNIKIVQLDRTDPKRPRPIKHPYKVDAYRFMSFFLEENSEHFDQFFNQIVDPIWIEQSDDPAARALREARQEGKKPPCWRILHRVTYVSRVLPPLDNSAPPSLEKALQTLDIESNYELIKQLEPYVANKLGSFPEFADAVRETIRQNLPELQPHTEEVIRYMSMYLGITGEQGAGGEQFGDTSLAELAPNQPPIVNAGLDQTIGLDGASVDADLEAVVIDDRLEKPEAIFVTWEKTSGPEGMTFNDLHAGATKATFTKRGRYELQLRAHDGMLEAADALTVIVNERPVVSAGANIETNALEIQLTGQILDTGLGDPATGVMTVQWLKSGGLGNVVFEDKNALQTKAVFEKPGNYLLQLLVGNGTFDTNAELLVGIAARVNRDLQVLYTFEENAGQTVKDASGTGEALDVQIPDLKKIAWLSGGLNLKNPVALPASGPAARLATAMRVSNEITLEAWLKPASAQAPGLARILTFSSGPAARNFTLAQSGGNYHLHLRTSTTNENASNKVLAGGQADTGKIQHLVCTRDAQGHARLYLDGVEVAARKVDGNFANWADNFALVLGHEAGGGSDDRAWTGELHLVAVYSRALAPSEILQNFNFGANLNLPPIVSAGPDSVVHWADYDWSKTTVQKKTFLLKGRVTHDRPTAGTVQWKQIGGPANGVKIQNENAAETTVEVPQKGRYVFRLTAQDGELLSSSETAVTVHVPPNVRIKSGTQKLPLTGMDTEAALVAELLDTGRGDQSANEPLTMRWSQTGGPQALQFSGADTLTAKAVFAARGFYPLQLEVHNGALGTVIPVQVTVNQMPVLSVAPPAVVTLPANQVALNGVVTDAGLGNPADLLDIRWEKADGPGKVTFADAGKAQTTARFDTGGVYSLQLTVRNPDNPALSATVSVPVTINRAPVVSAGPAPAPLLLKAGQANVTVWLDATVSDDGLPELPGATALKWTKKSGPGNMLISPDNADYVRALFTQKGKYVLQVEADDGAAKTTDTVAVIVNTPPKVHAGGKQQATVEGSETPVSLKGVLSDTGLGDESQQNTVAVHWKKLSGPGNAVPANPAALETSVALPKQRGVYTFELSADNGFDTAKHAVAVVVNLPTEVAVDVLATEPPNAKKRVLSVGVLDDGLGDPQQDTLSFVWKKLTGQEPVQFQPDPATPANTTVTFPKAGNYTLELTVGNGTGFVVKKTVAVTIG